MAPSDLISLLPNATLSKTLNKIIFVLFIFSALLGFIVKEVCSSYSFHQAPLWYSWEVARESCKSAQYTDLVSMESNDEYSQKEKGTLVTLGYRFKILFF